ncbi:hypothetical protein [Acholeplasma hippikon]|uniref:hypothetical protein n=1 Tax=Acholeplasma hippikon TaxID=264636 RepID=UPI00138E0B3B|nr:hypothetical protein [Acholeplasma hippikon]
MNHYKRLQKEFLLKIDSDEKVYAILGKEKEGKTTFIEAINTFSKVFKKSMRVLKHENEKPVYIFNFQIAKKNYEYKVVLNIERLEVVEEVLVEIYKDEKNAIFERTNQQIKIMDSLKQMYDVFDYQRLETYLYDLRFDKTRLILASIFDKDFETKKINFFKEIGEALNKIFVLEENELIYDLSLIDEKHYKKVMKSLENIGFKYDVIYFEPVNFDYLRKLFNRHLYDEFLDYVRVQMIESKHEYVYVYAFNTIFKIDGILTSELVIKEMMIHQKEQHFHYPELSKSERIMIKLLMTIYQDRHNAIYIYDDLFDSFDPSLLTMVLKDIDKELLFDRLIFTTHQLEVLNHKDYKHAQLKIIKANEIYNLNDLKIRADKKLSNFYIEFTK